LCFIIKKILIIVSIIIVILCVNKSKENIVIPNSSIRVRVVANSNNIEDQIIKIKVKEKVEKILYSNLNQVKTIEEARIKINNSIPKLQKDISKTINSTNFDINYGYNYFPEKNMLGINYKEGNYESIVINIGESKGKNWWCVLFPPICMIEVEKKDTNNVEYKSKVLEIIKEYS